MKKILILVPVISIGGLENVALTTARVLKETYDVHLLYFYNSDREQRIPENVKSYCLKTPYSLNKIKQIAILLKRNYLVKKYKKKHNFDISIAIGKTASYTNIMSKCKEKCIASLHGYTDIKKNILDNYILKKADKIICVCKALKNEFIKNSNINKERIDVLYNPFDIDKIISDSNKKGAKLKGKPCIISYGRIVKEKNYELSILAMKSIIRTYPNATLNILGDGANKENLIKLAQDENITENINFLSSDTNPFKYLKKAEVMFNTSFNEGFGNTIIEAFACRVPVISVDCKVGIRESIAPKSMLDKITVGIEKEEYGVLIEPSYLTDSQLEKEKKAKNLANAFLELYKENELMLELKEKGFKRSYQYDISEYRNNLIKILEE